MGTSPVPFTLSISMSGMVLVGYHGEVQWWTQMDTMKKKKIGVGPNSPVLFSSPISMSVIDTLNLSV